MKLVHVSFLSLCVLLEVWARRAADPDFPLPDPFHPLVAVLLAMYGVSLLVRGRRLRYALLTLAFAVPVLVLAMESWYAFRDRSIASLRLLVSDDRLLRYTYRPGAIVRGSGDSEGMTVTAEGLLDVPHAVPKPESVLRIVVLGDSVPNEMSLPFRQRFPQRLEAILGERLKGRRVEVVNVSCEGYNTIQEVRLFERVGLRYQPDIVVVAYVLNDPFLQNGAYRRFGNSFFAFRAAQVMTASFSSSCALFTGLHDGYAFDLVVRSSFERLRLLSEQHHFQVLVAPLPVLAPFDDPGCMSAYDKVVGVAREQGFAAGRVVDAFKGEDYHAYLKPDNRFDVTHPNAAGHEKMAARLADLVMPLADSTRMAQR